MEALFDYNDDTGTCIMMQRDNMILELYQFPAPELEKIKNRRDGHIDHIAFDASNNLAFIAALGNNTIEVVDINTKQVVHIINGLHEPQGVAFIPTLQRLVVANGDNGDCIFYYYY
jgi:YVTN family beta-propeller protein